MYKKFLLLRDVAKKLFPSSKSKQNLYVDEYNSAKIHMTHRSADDYARTVVKDKFKKK